MSVAAVRLKTGHVISLAEFVFSLVNFISRADFVDGPISTEPNCNYPLPDSAFSFLLLVSIQQSTLLLLIVRGQITSRVALRQSFCVPPLYGAHEQAGIPCALYPRFGRLPCRLRLGSLCRGCQRYHEASHHRDAPKMGRHRRVFGIIHLAEKFLVAPLDIGILPGDPCVREVVRLDQFVG